jgi:hypothetical protein
MKSHVTIVGLVFECAALMALAGCGDDTRPVKAPPAQQPANRAAYVAPPSAAAVTPSGAFRNELAEGSRQVGKVMTSLSAVIDPTQTDLNSAFSDYCNQLATMKDHAQRVKSEAEAMTAARDEYFAQWDKRASEINDASVRSAVEAERDRRHATYEKIRVDTQQVRDAYEPFLRDLTEVRKFLDGDLSRESASMLGGFQTQAQNRAATVRQKIGTLIHDLDELDTDTERAGK